MNIHEWILRMWPRDFPLKILELGAHYGEDSERILRAFPNGTAHLWECDPRCLEVLEHKRAVEENRHIHIVPYAVGCESKNGVVFHQSGGVLTPEGKPWDYSGSLKRPTFHLIRHSSVTFPTTTTVDVRVLDEWYAPDEKFNFVWMDIQGGEADAIEGGENLFRRCNFIYMEAEEVAEYDGQATELELRLVMAALGFDVIAKCSNNLLFENLAL